MMNQKKYERDGIYYTTSAEKTHNNKWCPIVVFELKADFDAMKTLIPMFKHIVKTELGSEEDALAEAKNYALQKIETHSTGF